MSAAGVTVSTSRSHREGRGPTPTAALPDIVVRPMPFIAARRLIERNHYLHSIPGGTKLTFGVFTGNELAGTVVLGAGPANAHSLVSGATADDGLCLTRLWLSDGLPRNSESHVIAVVLRALRKHTEIKFVISYADPSQGHLGTIYQAGGWAYIGRSQPMPLFDIGDGVARQSRSLAHGIGSHSVKYLVGKGVNVKLVEQSAKHRYVYFVRPTWRSRLKPPVLPYPKLKSTAGDHQDGVVGGGGGSGDPPTMGDLPPVPLQ